MIIHFDKEYKITREIKRGNTQMKPLFASLAQWIHDAYNDVTVLNIMYHEAGNGQPPRLLIICEFEKDRLRFMKKDGNGYLTREQKKIISAFEKLTSGVAGKSYDTKDIQVEFSAFAPVAQTEANESVPEEKILALQKEYKNIWGITRFFQWTTVFFFTEQQVDENAEIGMHEVLSAKYFDLLQPYDEFGYFDRENFSVIFDSKENFDTNYNSNWYLYYK